MYKQHKREIRRLNYCFQILKVIILIKKLRIWMLWTWNLLV